MQIHLKRHEKLYLNGAVIRLDRRGTIELLNDANFLMENHILQPEQATTPLKQIYFLVQLMLMDPPNAHLMMELFNVNVAQLRRVGSGAAYEPEIGRFEERVRSGSYYEAMKIIRQAFKLESVATTPAGGEHIKSMEAA